MSELSSTLESFILLKILEFYICLWVESFETTFPWSLSADDYWVQGPAGAIAPCSYIFPGSAKKAFGPKAGVPSLGN